MHADTFTQKFMKFNYGFSMVKVFLWWEDYHLHYLDCFTYLFICIDWNWTMFLAFQVPFILNWALGKCDCLVSRALFSREWLIKNPECSPSRLPPRSISCSRLSILARPNSLINWSCSIICQVMLCRVGRRSKSSPNRPRESYCRSLM